MLNRLLLLDFFLLLAIVALGIRLYDAWTEAPVPARTVSARPDTPLNPAQPAPVTPPPLAAFEVVAEQNLFSPTRGEATPAPSKPAPIPARAATAPKPRLYGVILGTESGPRAFLEDPRTRKVFSYAIGDSVAESRVEEIKADRVTLRRGDEVFEVLLRDPSKPKPVPVPPARVTPRVRGRRQPGVPGVPGAAPGQPGAPVRPGRVPRARPSNPQIPPVSPPVRAQPRPQSGATAPYVPSSR